MALEDQGPGSVTLGEGDRAAALAAAKARLGVSLDNDDGLLAAFVESALGLAEQFTGRVLIARAMARVLPVVCGWQRLGPLPVRSIASIEGLASDGSAAVLPPVDYAIDIDAAGEGWVRIGDAGGAGRVRVTLTAGIADDWPSLPAAIREGVTMLAGYLYAARDATQPPPAAITALWRPYRAAAMAVAGHA